MRKTGVFIVFILSLLVLSGCSGQSKEGFFAYQEKVSEVKASVQTDGGEYKIRMYFEGKEGDEFRRCKSIVYLSPENISGLTFRKEGNGTKAEMDGLIVDGDFFDTEEIFAFEKLFCLESKSISSIKSSEDDTTVATGSSDEILWTVTTGKDGIPREIKASGIINCTLKIEEFKADD